MDKYRLFVQWRNLPPQLPHCHGPDDGLSVKQQPLLPSQVEPLMQEAKALLGSHHLGERRLKTRAKFSKMKM